MIVIAVYNKEKKFLGYFNFNSLEYALIKSKGKYIINTFKPLLNEAYIFSNEDLTNGVIKDHVTELTKFFNNVDSLYKGYFLKIQKYTLIKDYIHDIS